MTPAARAAAAISVLDDILAGVSAEKCLSDWGRANRYAGSKDRAAVRDHVFDVLRCKRSFAARGGGMSGRALILGLYRSQGIDPDGIFGAGGYGPAALTPDEYAVGSDTVTGAEKFDFPDWIWPIWQADLGDKAQDAAQVLQQRGPVTLRVNLRRGTQAGVINKLAEDGIIAVPVGDIHSALQVIENERRIRTSHAFQQGLIELQDLASQEAVAGLNLPNDARVLDYCAGGGGKALAIADRFDCNVFAHDISAPRTVDIAPRAARAGVVVTVLKTAQIRDAAPFDLVFVDAPCSGSGTWRRAPEAKWALTESKLNDYKDLQYEVLKNASEFLGRGGQMIYATCSVFDRENRQVVSRFLTENPAWDLRRSHQRVPDEAGDGFYHAVLHRQ